MARWTVVAYWSDTGYRHTLANHEVFAAVVNVAVFPDSVAALTATAAVAGATYVVAVEKLVLP